MGYLDQPFEKPTAPPTLHLALKAFNMMSGAIDYSALPLVAEYLQIDDIDTLITELLQIEQYARDKKTEVKQ